MSQKLPEINRSRIPVNTIVVAAAIIIIALFLLRSVGQFFYFLEQVEPQEIGVKLRGGQIVEVVGPGVYSDVGLYANLRRVSSTAVPFTVQDDELITKDKQRIGLVVAGDIFRPGTANTNILLQKWAQYSNIYLSDEAARETITNRVPQAMKICIGDRIFDEAVIGTARDELRICINDQLSKIALEYGLTVSNIAVPNVILLPEAQARLDEIVQSRLQTEKAKQDELRAKAEAAAEQARQEGEIRVAQSRLQEETRQQTILAVLDKEKIESQKQVIEAERFNELAKVEANRAIIEAQKSNDLLGAQKDLEIQVVAAQAAAERAKVEVATQLALAELYGSHPEFLQLNIAQANADALSPSDKIIFTPEGTTPTIVLPGPGIVPTVDTNQKAASDQ